jgi:hypothetical protein
MVQPAPRISCKQQQQQQQQKGTNEFSSQEVL